VSKADDIFWREFGVVLTALVLFTVIVFFTARTIGANTFEMMRNSPQAVLDRIQPIGQVRVGESGQQVAAAAPDATAMEKTAAAPDAGGKSGEAIYNGVCMACHAAGVAGAPKIGDKAAWEPRVAQGMDALVASSIKGKGAMPPKGGNTSLSDAEIRNAVEYMLQQAGLAEAGAASSAPAAPEQSQAAAQTETAQPEAASGAADGVSAAAGEAVYSKACVACHSTGVAGAPKVGDTAAWEPRLAQGMDTLVGSSINGKGAMPPKGGYVNLSDAEIKSAVLYMLKQAGLEPG